MMNKKAFAEIKEILKEGDINDVRALFQFDSNTPAREVIFKFQVWVRYFYPGVFKAKDAPFHREIDAYNLKVYRGEIVVFVDIVFRDGAKTTRTKFFTAFCIGNDKDRSKKLIKILSKDRKNAGQSVTDVYNALIATKHAYFYPELFEKTDAKRQESMNVFMTSTGIKVDSDSVGVDQRGDQVYSDDDDGGEIARPDLVIYDDFETRKTLRSATETNSIWLNMEEARTGLSKDGGAIYLCNYISESGNVHKLVSKYSDREDSKVLIVPIIDKNGTPMWDRFTVEEIKQKMSDSEDPEGEYMCNPQAGADAFIDRASIDRMIKHEKPKVEVAGFKMYYPYNPSHRYGSGHDVAGGVGLDSSASVFIDFSTVPARVVATYANNLIIPEDFGHEIIREASYYNNPIVAPERNFGTECIYVLKTEPYEGDIYMSQVKKTGVHEQNRKDYGWHTNSATKPEMLRSLKKAIEDGLLELTDPALIREARAYTRNDLMDNTIDPRFTTRHFDLFIACAIAWQMKTEAEVVDVPQEGDDDSHWEEEHIEQIFDEIGV